MKTKKQELIDNPKETNWLDITQNELEQIAKILTKENKNESK